MTEEWKNYPEELPDDYIALLRAFGPLTIQEMREKTGHQEDNMPIGPALELFWVQGLIDVDDNGKWYLPQR